MLSRNPLTVEVIRGPVVESSHQVMVVVVDSHGRVVHGWGNVQFLTVPRSSIKMLQVLPLLETGAFEKFNLTDQHLALACASHRGEKEHIEVARDWLEKIGLKESDLACGGHLPYNEKAMTDFLKRGESLSPVYSNCVGKHLALLTTALHLKEPVKGYEDPAHPAQQRVRKVLTEVMKIDHTKIPHGIDGCNVPTYPVPLQNIAMGMSVFLSSKETELRKMAVRRVLTAVTENSSLVSGTDDFAYEVMKGLKYKAILKGGAEGVYTGVVPDKGITFAVKVADGAARAAQYTVMAMLKNFSVVNDLELQALQHLTNPVLKNTVGKPVGSLRFRKD